MLLDDGTRVGNYVIEAFLGSGGMASVYRVRHRVLQSVHALKVLAEHLGRSRELRVRFLKEGQVLAQVQHPGLVRVTDVVDEPACAGLVMDLLEGEDLARRVARAGPLAPAEVAGIALQALSAIGHAHEAGVIHRDLKPANLFLVPRGGHRPPLVKVLDFGIAKLAGSDLTRGSGAMGTVAYMSPEQIELPAEVDERSDLFSLGVVLFELLVGENPFRADTDYLIMQRITAGDS